MPQGGSVPGPPPQLVDSALSDVVQSCLTLCDPMGCILPGSSVHGVFQARTLECIAISSSRTEGLAKLEIPTLHSQILPRLFPRDSPSESEARDLCKSFWETLLQKP